MENKNLTLQINLDQVLTAYENPSTRILEINLQAAKRRKSSRRPSLNLALVIDRSGSMAGEKLDYAKKAARHVVGLMAEKDRVALVDYDDHVRVLFQSVLLDDETRPEMIRAIESIHTGGGTNLGGGWLTGCQEISSGIGSGVFSHTLLLSDGLANVGITSHEELSMHARELAQRSISTSTFGVGEDFDQNLLEAMANQGEGIFRFIETPGEIPHIFESVFKELLSIIAHEIEVNLSFPPEISAEVLGDYRFESPEPGKLRILLGSISAEKQRQVFVKFAIPAGEKDSVLPIKVSLRAKDEQGGLIELSANAEVRRTSWNLAQKAPHSDELLKRFAQVEVGDKASAALKMEKEGKRQEASEMLNQILDSQQDHLDPQQQTHFRAMSSRMATGMDELDRKRSHYETYRQKRSWVPQETYPLKDNVRGHIVFEKENTLFLLDTGSSVSFGTQANLEFMDRRLHLPSSFPKLSPENLSQLIGVSIEFLLGMDVLQHLCFQIDLANKRITFSEYPFQAGSERLRIETLGGVPYTHIRMNGSSRKVILDTGAKINFISKHALDGLQPVDKDMDFHPFVGEFETQVYRIPVEIAGKIHQMRCGMYTPFLEQYLTNNGGFEGALGAELLNKYVASYNMPDQMFLLEPVTG